MTQERDAAVQALLDREAIRELLLRYARAVDRQDEALLASVYHPGAVHVWGDFEGPAEQFVPSAIRNLERYELTTHLISNEQISIDGDHARSECLCVATHRLRKDGAPHELVMSLRYLDELERRDGEWRITRRLAVHDWSREGPVTTWSGSAALAQGARGPDDPGHGRLG